jgi:hypothetical protein
MPAQFFGAQGAVTILNRAFANTSPSFLANANQVTNATSAGLEPGLSADNHLAYRNFALSFGKDYTSKTEAELATLLLTNMGVLPSTAPEVQALETAIADYIKGPIGGGKGNIGYIALQLGAILSDLEADPIYGTAAKAWNKEVNDAATYSLNPANTKESVGEAAPPTVQGQTYTLTVGVDAVPGTAGDDVIVGSGSTLNAGDTLNGGTGTDLLAVNTNAANTIGAFTAAGIETIQATAIAGASRINLANTKDVTTVSNTGSDSAVTFDQVQSLATVSASNTAPVTGSAVNPDLTALFKDSLLAGTADTVKLALNNAKLGVVTLGSVTSNGASGVETLDITTSGAASTISTTAGAATIKVSGDQALTITNALTNLTVKTVDASGLTAGGLTLNLTGNTENVTVTGGKGDDNITFNGSLRSKDSYDGGDGKDTLGVETITQVDEADDLSNVKNVEVLNFTAATGGTLDVSTTGTANAAKIGASVTGFVFGAGLNADVALTGMTQPSSVSIVGDAADKKVTVALKTNGNADALTFASTIAPTDSKTNSTVNTLTATGYEELTLSSTDKDRTTKEGLIVSSLKDADLTKVTVTGTGNVTVSASDATKLATVDGSAATGNLSLVALGTASTTAMTVTGGTGDDMLAGGNKADSIVGGAGADTISGSVGADTVTGGDGADVFAYTAANQSGTSAAIGFDTITDFVSGTDKIDLTGIDINKAIGFRGVHATTTQAINALTKDATAIDVVFVSSENALVADLDANGQIDSGDLYVKLNGVTTITAADIGANATGGTITLTAASAVVNTTTNTNASAKTTNNPDTINSTIAFLTGSTIDGAVGTDTLALSTAGTVNINNAGAGGTVTNVETLTLAAGANTISFTGASGIKNVTGNTGADDVNAANMTAGGTVSLGDGNDKVSTAAAMASTTIDLGAGDDTFVSTIGATLGAMTLTGGAGTDTLSLGAGDIINTTTISGFENLTLAGAVAMTNAQYAALSGGTVTAGAGKMVTISDAATVTAVTNLPELTFGNFTNSFTSAVTADQNIVGGTGADTFTYTAGLTAADTITGGNGTDTLNINFAMAANAVDFTALKVATVENVKIGAAQPSGTYTLMTDIKTFDASIDTAAMTLASVVDQTSIKLGSGNDTITKISLATAAGTRTVELGAGNDTIAAIDNTGFAANNLIIDSGTGNLTINDLTTGARVPNSTLTLKFGTDAAATIAANVAATTKDFAVGDIFDFATNVTTIFNGAINGVNGAGIVGQLYVDTTSVAGNTILTFDANGDKGFGLGDVQITIVGQTVTGGIVNGNFVVG